MRDGSRHRRSESPSSERRSRHRARRRSRDLRPSPGGDWYRTRNDVRRATHGVRHCQSPTNSRRRRTSFRRASRSRSCRRVSPYHRGNETRRRNDSPTRSSAYRSWSSVGQRGGSASPKRQHRKTETEGRLDNHTRSKAAAGIATIGSREAFRRATGQIVRRRCSESQDSVRSHQAKPVANEDQEAGHGHSRCPGRRTRTASPCPPLQRESLGVERDGERVNQGAAVDAKCLQSERPSVGARRLSRSQSLTPVSADDPSEASRSRRRVVSDGKRNLPGGAAHFLNQKDPGERQDQDVESEVVQSGESQEKGDSEGDRDAKLPTEVELASDSTVPTHEVVSLGRSGRVRPLDKAESFNMRLLPPAAEDGSKDDVTWGRGSTKKAKSISDHATPTDSKQGKELIMKSQNKREVGQKHEMESFVVRDPCAHTSTALSRCADGRVVLASEVDVFETKASEVSRVMRVQHRSAFRKEPLYRGRHLQHEKRAAVAQAHFRSASNPDATGCGRPRLDRHLSSQILRVPFPVGNQHGKPLRSNPSFFGQLQQDHQINSSRFPFASGPGSPPLSRSQLSYPPSQWNAPKNSYPVSPIPRPSTRASPWNGGTGRQDSKWRHDMYEQIAHEPEKHRKRFNLYGETLEAVD